MFGKGADNPEAEMGFFDHVEALRWVRVKDKLVPPGSRFVRPDGQVNPTTN